MNNADLAVLNSEGVRQIGNALKAALSIAFLTRGRDLPKLFLLLHALRATNFMTVLQNLLGEIISAYNRACVEFSRESSVVKAILSDKSLKTDLIKLKADISTAKNQLVEIEKSFKDKKITPDVYTKMSGELKAKLKQLLSLLEGDANILKRLDESLIKILTAVKAVIASLDLNHLKPMLTNAYSSLLGAVAVANSRTAASATIGVNFGNIVYDKVMQLISSSSLVVGKNRWLVGVIHSACVSLGVFASFITNEIVSLSSAAMAGSDALMRVLSDLVFDPISAASNIPRLAEYPVMYHTVQTVIMAFGMIANMNPMKSGISDILFFPLLAFEAFLSRLMPKK
jgi:hypothetical protein